MGIEVLEWFARQDDYNLIFAPHVMLFRRRLHTSVEHRRIRLRRRIPERLRNLSHIRIDTGSQNSVDMSYVLAADIYLGMPAARSMNGSPGRARASLSIPTMHAGATTPTMRTGTWDR